MKSCPYCGAQYGDDVLICPNDQHPLGEVAKLQKEPPKGKVICPKCGARGDYTFLIEPRSAFSWPVFFTGGLLAMMFRNAGHRRQVRCNQCAGQFCRNGSLSKFSRAIFWLLISLGLANYVSFLVFIIVTFFSH